MAHILIKSKDENYGGELLRNMQFLQQGGQLCDVVLVAAMDGQKFSCHRLVLAACSQFFKAMFTSPMLESQQPEIPLGEVYGDRLQSLLHFCYTGAMELQENSDADTVKELLCTASLLQLDAAVVACADFLEKQITPANCLGMFALADQYNMNGLKSVAEKYIGEEFVKLCQSQEFLQLSFAQLAKLIGSDELRVPSEQVVFDSVMSWVQHYALDRNKHIPELLKLVRLPLLSARFLAKQVRPVCIEQGCQQLLLDVLLWQCDPEEQNDLSPLQTKPRKSESKNLLAVFNKSDGLNIESYCHTSGAWSPYGLIDPKRLNFAVAILNDKLVIVGGFHHDCNALDTLQCFDLKTKTSTQLASMRTPRHRLDVAVLDGRLYAVGGFNGRTYLNTVERYDPVANAWSSVASMTVARGGLGVAVVDGRLYAVGGCENSSDFSTTECYDPCKNQWTSRASMAQQRSGHGLAAANGFLYAVGGCCNNCVLSSVERYDPRIDKWSQLCALNSARGTLDCTFVGEHLLAFNASSKNVEEYNVEKDSWTASLLPKVMQRLKVVSTPKLN